MRNPWPVLKAIIGGNTPIYVHFGLTHRCNLTCAMCGLWKKGNKDEELSLEQIETAASHFRQLGTTAISLGGGEPFLRSDLPQIVAAFINNGIETRVLTNALAGSPDLHEAVAAAGLRHISISLDTPNPQVQSEICHKPEIWAKIIERVRFWSSYIQKRSGTGILNCVVSARNINDIPQMVAIAKAYNFYLSLVPLEKHSYQGEILSCSPDSEDMRFASQDEAKLDCLLEYLCRLKKQSHSPIFNSMPYLKAMINFLKCGCQETSPEKSASLNANFWGTGIDCQTGTLSFSVSPDGRCSMCHFQDESPEDHPKVYEDNFISWYKHQRNLAKIKELRRNCQACFRPCWWEIALTMHNSSSFINALNLNFRRFPDKQLPSPSELAEIIKKVPPLC
ncbi:MAG: radical SAM protein [Candidatus Bruticola sp.]